VISERCHAILLKGDHWSIVVASFAIIWAGILIVTPPARALVPQPPPTVGQDGKDVGWVPTPDELIDTMLTLADLTADDYLVDLGSGDGRTVIAAAKRGAQALGVEYDAGLVNLSRMRAYDAGVSDRTTFVNTDLFEVALNDATVITLFLLPDLNLKLRPTLLGLTPGTRIVSNTWDMDDWTADETVQINPCPGFCTALLWVVPAQIGGTWRDATGELIFTQEFQMVSGTVQREGRITDITDGRLRGRHLMFSVQGSQYSGHLGATNDLIQGTVTTDAHVVEWLARR